MGKSRLLAEFSARARGAGARVLTGRCLELAHGGLPFAGQLAGADLAALLDVSGKLLDRLRPGSGACHDQA